MEKRTLLAVVLSVAVLYAFSYFFPQTKAPVPQKPTTVSSVATTPVVAPAPVKQEPTGGLPSSPAAVSDRDVVVETDAFTAILSSRGGSIKKLTLKKYRETTGPGAKQVTLFNEADPDHFYLTGKGLGIDPAALFSVDVDRLEVKGTEKKTVTFSQTSPQGVIYRKTYTFTGDGYGIDLDNHVINSGVAPLTGALQLALPYRVEPAVKESRFENHGPVVYADSKFIAETAKDLEKAEKNFSTNVQWSGNADKYFLDAVIAKNASIASVSIKKSPKNYLISTISSPAVTVNPGQQGAVSYKLYFGPKDLDILKSQGSSLENAIDLGWFAIIAKPLLHSLQFFYKYVHNYGIAIIIITIILKMLFYPLTHKSYKSMKEMQKLQPKMTALREKYKDDRDSLNKKVMELYQEHKVNPLGGCLPMVVQIPVFFALYKALMSSIELRHAPFYFWIQDLAAKDPYYVTPIIMGVTMVIQQKMTPSQMDPMQQKMMMALPVVFTFMFLNFPSGLVIYWLVNNVLTIGQQYYINKTVT